MLYGCLAAIFKSGKLTKPVNCGVIHLTNTKFMYGKNFNNLIFLISESYTIQCGPCKQFLIFLLPIILAILNFTGYFRDGWT